MSSGVPGVQELQEFRRKMNSAPMVSTVKFAGFLILELLNSCNS
jgi:hypothetical protein